MISFRKLNRYVFGAFRKGIFRSRITGGLGLLLRSDSDSTILDLVRMPRRGISVDELLWLPQLPPELIAPFHAIQNSLRRAVNRWVVVIFTIIFDLFLFAQFNSAPEIVPLSGVLRLAVFSPCVLAFVCLDRFAKLGKLYDPALLALAIAPSAISAVLFVQTTSLASVSDVRATPLILLTTGMIWRMPPASVFINAAVSMGAFVGGILWDAAIPRAELGSMILTDVAIGLAVSVFSVQLDARDRRVFISNATERELRRELALRNAELLTDSQTDALTGVPNRRCFDDELPARWLDCKQRVQSISLIMIDIDHFKRYNDHYGHQGGDDCLRRVATEIKRLLRPGDLVARYGGEEFVAILRDAPPQVGALVAERIRAGVAALALPHAGVGPDAIVTISLGVATSAPTAERGIGALIDLADGRLYEAKRDGRNRVSADAGNQSIEFDLRARTP